MSARFADYSKMTEADFDQYLTEILARTPISVIRTIGNIETELREEFNNEVLARWAAANPDLAYPEQPTIMENNPPTPPAPFGIWQPIETAPKDGTPILVCVDGYWPTTVRWDADHQAWEDDNDNLTSPENWPLTHWMPELPTPSEQANYSVATISKGVLPVVPEVWDRAVDTLASMCIADKLGKGPTKDAFILALRIYADQMERLLHPEIPQ